MSDSRKPVERLAEAAGRWWRKLRGRTTEVERPRDTQGMTHLHAVRFLIGTEACSELELALRRGHQDAAERAIERAMRIDPTMPRLTELRAWHLLRTGRPCDAMKIIESEPVVSGRLKLLHQVVRIQAGERAAAHLELHAWSRQEHCPPAARVLLAWLEWHAGHGESARAALQAGGEEQLDPDAVQLLLLMDLADDLPASVQKQATVLAHRFANQRSTAAFLESMNLANHIDATAVPLDMIEELAGELLEKPHLISTLVAGQRANPSVSRIELLRRAIVRIADDLSEPMAALTALSELALLADDADDARRWARHGLKRDPLSATLGLMLDRTADQPDPHSDEPPLEVLERLAAARPYYPDIQRALVKRYLREGMTEKAQNHLAHWQAHQPDQPLAERTRRELAA